MVHLKKSGNALSEVSRSQGCHIDVSNSLYLSILRKVEGYCTTNVRKTLICALRFDRPFSGGSGNPKETSLLI